MVGLRDARDVADWRRGFPTDLPMVGLMRLDIREAHCRGFPTDLPMVGLQCSR